METPINKSEVLSNNFPQVRFGIDIDLDIDKITDFISRENKKGGHDFNEIILRIHPGLKGLENFSKKEKRVRIGQYVNGVYQDRKEEFEEASNKINQAWGEYAPEFFTESSEIFKRLDWPQGDYRGFITISPPYPRYLNEKVFQVGTNMENGLRTTAHEMLHFLFYEYVRKRYTHQLIKTLEGEMSELLEGKFKIPLWELSEVFNTALLTEKRFGRGGSVNPRPYPALVEDLKTCKKVWKEAGGDIDLFFSRMEV